jgi:hypothetical protein
MSFYCIGLLKANIEGLSYSEIAFRFITFLVLTIFVAAFGFLLNEWTDIKDDEIAKKNNALKYVSKLKIWIIFSFITAGIFLASLFVPWPPYTFLLLVLQLLLFILYSAPPFRLKKIRPAAMVLDALYSGTLFYIIAMLVGGQRTPDLLPPILLVFSWGFCRGLRNIIYHFIMDAEHDILLQKERTFFFNTDFARKMILRVILPGEILLYFFLLYFFPHHTFFCVSYLLFIIYVYFRKDYTIPFLLKRKNEIQVQMITDINIYYEIIMPIVSLSLVIYYDILLIPLFCLFLTFFPQAFKWIKHFYLQAFSR